MTIHIFGGGTIMHVRSHMALCAPAKGGTARKLAELLRGKGASCELHLTGMADPDSSMDTNDDVEAELRRVLALPETHPRLIGGTDPDESVPPGFRALLRRPNVLTSALIAGLCGGAMIAHVAGLPFFLQDERGLGPAGYSAVFAMDATGMVLASNTNRLLLRRWTARSILSVSVPTMLASGVVFALLLRAEAPLVAVLPSLFLMVSTWGFVMPNAIAAGMSVERTAAGRASAILGATQFGISAVSAPLVGTLPVLAGVPPMATVIVVCLAGAAVVQLVARFVPAGQGDAAGRAPARPS